MQSALSVDITRFWNVLNLLVFIIEETQGIIRFVRKTLVE